MKKKNLHHFAVLMMTAVFAFPALAQNYTLPQKFILVPDPEDTSIPYNPGVYDGVANDEYLLTFKYDEALCGAATEVFRLSTPLIKLDRPKGKLVISIISTPRRDTGHECVIDELYLLDSAGNRVALTIDNLAANAMAGEATLEALVNDIVSVNPYFDTGFADVGLHTITVTLPSPMDEFQLVFENVYNDWRIENAPFVIQVDGEDYLVPLRALLEEAKSVAAQEWSENVANALAQLKELIATIESELAADSLTKDNVGTRLTELQDAINNVRIDAVWNLLDALQIFVEFPEDVSESNPVFGLTSHQGFGNEDGMFPISQQEALRNLMDEVGLVLYEVDAGIRSVETAFAYIDIINEAVAHCIAMVIKNASLPHNFILVPDPENASIPYHPGDGLMNDSYLQTFRYDKALCGTETAVFRLSTPLIHPKYFVEQITISIVNTPRKDTGYECIIDELYILDGDGNRVALTADDITTNAIESEYGATLDALVNNEVSSWPYFGTGFATSVGPHTLTITLPVPMEDFQIIIENLYNDWRIQNSPFEVTINADSGDQAIIDLQTCYAVTVNAGYTEGTDPGYVKDLSALNAALVVAKKLLSEGGSDAEIYAAIKAINDAVAGIEYVQVEQGKKYYLVSAAPWNMDNYGTDLAIYYDSVTGVPAWTIFNRDNQNYLWEFEPVDGDVWGIKNDVSGTWLDGELTENQVLMKDSPAGYSVEPLGKGIVALVSTAAEAPYNCIHTAGYGNASGYGTLTYWESVAGGSQWRIQTYDDTGIDITPADPEPLSRMAEGFYDLTGRRIAHPTSGLYISKGKKVFVK